MFKMKEKIQSEKIINLTSQVDYEQGKQISKKEITLVTKNSIRDHLEYLFRIKSSKSNDFYFIHISPEKKNQEIKFYCNCPKFNTYKTCKHVASCLHNYYELFFQETSEERKIALSKEIFNFYRMKKNQFHRKEEVSLEYELRIENHYYGDNIFLNIKIGTYKKYSLNNKIKNFLIAYQKQEIFSFGKDFIYNPEKHFFSDANKTVLNLLNVMIYNLRNNEIPVTSHDLKVLLPLLSQNLKINNQTIQKIEEKSPYEINLTKEQKNYKLKIHITPQEIKKLTNDGEYTYKNNIIYHMPMPINSLIQQMHAKKIEELIFSESDLNEFSTSILPIVKNEMIIDSSIENLSLEDNPDVKIYIDFQESNIVAKVLFEYNKETIDFFETKNMILRDMEFENTIIEDLKMLKFQIKKNKLILENIDDIGEFFNTGLKKLSEKYEVYTTEKIRKTKVYHNSKTTSTFQIGKDNLLKYNFELENVNEQELEKVLLSLKQKKKYFRLSTGDILSLESSDFLELQSLLKDLEFLNQEEEIPKYYALYLNSLKNQKYHIVKTNEQFDTFIQNFQKYQQTSLQFTENENKILREYQKEGIKWLYTLYKCSFGGILADEMGLGKSLQTITFFQKVLEENPQSKFLIIAPISLLYNWKREFTKFAPHISVEILSDLKKIRIDKLEEWNKTVYITSYGLLREDYKMLEKKSFEICVIDEAQYIKNPKAGITLAVKKIKAKMNLALTGTPIENSVVELWSIFDFLMPGFLSTLSKFQNKYRILEYNEQTTERLEKLEQEISPFILRRKKSDVAKDLPDKIENIVYIDLSEKEKEIYAAEVEKVKKQMEEKIHKEGFVKSRFEILKLITRLRQLCITPKIIYENYPDPSSKIENLKKILNGVISNNHKVLLFTSFKTALEIVRQELNKNNITNYTIDGSIPSKKRMELVDKFNQDQTQVFLIMLKSGGTGLNLTSADVVIHLDLWWNPQAENQATDRTHRIGQNKKVEVIKLVTKGTIEEKILELQEKKQNLSAKLIDNQQLGAELLKKLTVEDIRKLLASENSL